MADSKADSLREQKLKEMQDPKSDLRQQNGADNTADFQLLSNTPAETIAAMTGKSLSELKKRADELGVTLKGSLAGDIRG